MRFKSFTKKAAYSITQNHVAAGGWIWSIHWKWSGKYFMVPDHCGIEPTETEARQKLIAHLGDLSAFAARFMKDEPFTRAIANGRTAGIPDLEAVSKLMERR
ncbi:MAG: hypothetical protein HQL69_21555, partial [Magnetococcales bacterium]|nr:hypothetical protein [Magnetococcales bacterium]